MSTIHQAELQPVLVAVQMWGEALRGRRIIIFVDNEAARAALVKGDSRNKASAAIVASTWEQVAEVDLYPWIDRVPTRSNLADGPSRGDWSLAEQLGVRRQDAKALV